MSNGDLLAVTALTLGSLATEVRLLGALAIGRWPRTLHSSVRKERTGLGRASPHPPTPGAGGV